MPDDVVFVDEIPHTATGKIQKMKLREQFKDYRLPTDAAAACGATAPRPSAAAGARAWREGKAAGWPSPGRLRAVR